MTYLYSEIENTLLRFLIIVEAKNILLGGSKMSLPLLDYRTTAMPEIFTYHFSNKKLYTVDINFYRSPAITETWLSLITNLCCKYLLLIANGEKTKTRRLVPGGG